jgi:hypothetical protein
VLAASTSGLNRSTVVTQLTQQRVQWICPSANAVGREPEIRVAHPDEVPTLAFQIAQGERSGHIHVGRRAGLSNFFQVIVRDHRVPQPGVRMPNLLAELQPADRYPAGAPDRLKPGSRSLIADDRAIQELRRAPAEADDRRRGGISHQAATQHDGATKGVRMVFSERGIHDPQPGRERKDGAALIRPIAQEQTVRHQHGRGVLDARQTHESATLSAEVVLEAAAPQDCRRIFQGHRGQRRGLVLPEHAIRQINGSGRDAQDDADPAVDDCRGQGQIPVLLEAAADRGERGSGGDAKDGRTL